MDITSYEIIGSKEKAVAIVEIPDNLKGKEKSIAKEIMKRHKYVVSVLKKKSERTGEYRIREYEIIKGKRDTEVIHKENGCYLLLDPQKVYFSTREGTERLRIAKAIKNNETVMVMFAGVCPFSVNIAKQQPKVKRIISIELNPDAVYYMKENIKLNKLQGKIIPVDGDVKKECKKWYGKCDRVIMPLPHESWKFVSYAVNSLKSNGYIHLYFFDSDKKVEKNVYKKIEKLKSKSKRKITYKIRKVLPYAPGINKYCVDMKLSN